MQLGTLGSISMLMMHFARHLYHHTDILMTYTYEDFSRPHNVVIELHRLTERKLYLVSRPSTHGGGKSDGPCNFALTIEDKNGCLKNYSK